MSHTTHLVGSHCVFIHNGDYSGPIEVVYHSDPENPSMDDPRVTVPDMARIETVVKGFQYKEGDVVGLGPYDEREEGDVPWLNVPFDDLRSFYASYLRSRLVAAAERKSVKALLKLEGVIDIIEDYDENET